MSNAARRLIRQVHPIGWEFNTVPDGWEPDAQVVNDRDGWDDDVPVDDGGPNDHRNAGAAPSSGGGRPSGSLRGSLPKIMIMVTAISVKRRQIAFGVFLTQVGFKEDELGVSWN